jgi:hypothetical protein
MRLKTNHSNKQIDTSKTRDNESGFDLSCEQAIEKFEQRINTLDNTTNTNKRKDRVEMFSLEVPIPQEFCDEDLMVEFANLAIEQITDKYGDENLIEVYLHVDEVHSYVDAKTKQVKQSLPHLHVCMVPEIEGKLKGKEFSSKKNMRDLNKRIDEECKKQFGISFMTGTRKKSNYTVEELKTVSSNYAHDLLEKERNLKDKEISIVNKEKDLNAREGTLNTLQSDITRKRSELNAKESVLADKETKLNTRERNINQKVHEINDKLNERQSKLNKRKSAIQNKEEHLVKFEESLKARKEKLEREEYELNYLKENLKCLINQVQDHLKKEEFEKELESIEVEQLEPIGIDNNQVELDDEYY